MTDSEAINEFIAREVMGRKNGWRYVVGQWREYWVWHVEGLSWDKTSILVSDYDPYRRIEQAIEAAETFGDLVGIEFQRPTLYNDGRLWRVRLLFGCRDAVLSPMVKEKSAALSLAVARAGGLSDD